MKVKLRSARPVGVCMKGHMESTTIRALVPLRGRVGEDPRVLPTSIGALMDTMHESVLDELQRRRDQTKKPLNLLSASVALSRLENQPLRLDPHAPPTCDPSPNENVAFLSRGGAYRPPVAEALRREHICRSCFWRATYRDQARRHAAHACKEYRHRRNANQRHHHGVRSRPRDVAAASDLREMIVLVERATGLSAADAYSLCSIAADMHVTQLVNLHKGIHVMLAKSALQKRSLQQT